MFGVFFAYLSSLIRSCGLVAVFALFDRGVM